MGGGDGDDGDDNKNHPKGRKEAEELLIKKIPTPSLLFRILLFGLSFLVF